MAKSQGGGFRADWRKRYRKEESAVKDYVSRDVFANWDKLRNPSSVPLDCLWLATEAIFGHGDEALISSLLEKTILTSERLLTESTLATGYCKSEYPANRSRVLRAYWASQGLLNRKNGTLILRDASDTALVWCSGLRGKWGPGAEETFLSAVRLCLIESNFQRTIEILQQKQKFRYHQSQYDLWKSLAMCELRPDKVIADDLRSFFDMLRNPRFSDPSYTERTLLLLETGYLLQKISSGRIKHANWQNIVDSIAE